MTWPAHDEFNTGSTPGADWANFHVSAGSSQTVSGGSLHITALHGSGGWEGLKWDGVDDSSPWIVTAKMSAGLSSGSIVGIGLVAAGGGMVIFFLYNNAGTMELWAQRFSDSNTHFADDRGPDHFGSPVYWRVEWDGTHYKFSWSVDSVTWAGGVYGDFYEQYTPTGVLSGGATGLLLIVQPANADSKVVVDWVRPGSDVTEAAWLAPPAPPAPPTPPPAVFVPNPAAQVNHVATGLSRLLTQFKGKATIEGLIRAPLGASDIIEGVLYTLLTQRMLSNAVGAELDKIGSRFGFERDGRNDDDYRAIIPVWIRALRSSGTTPQIVDVLDGLNPSNTLAIEDMDLDPAGFRVRVTDPVLSAADRELYRRFIRTSRGAAIRCWFYSWPAAGSTLFQFNSSAGAPVADTAHGFNHGKFASEVIA